MNPETRAMRKSFERERTTFRLFAALLCFGALIVLAAAIVPAPDNAVAAAKRPCAVPNQNVITLGTTCYCNLGSDVVSWVVDVGEWHVDPENGKTVMDTDGVVMVIHASGLVEWIPVLAGNKLFEAENPMNPEDPDTYLFREYQCEGTGA